MAHAQKLSIVSANESAATSKPAAKPAAKKTPAPRKTTAKKTTAPAKWDNALITRIAENVTAIAKADELKAVLEMDIKKFRTYKVKLGASRRTCGISQEFFAAFMSLGVKEKTATNYLSCLRESINNGKPFSLNQSRDNAKSKGKAAPKGKPGTTWKEPSEVLDALAIAINNVKQKAGAAMFERAMAMAPDGFDFALADFLEAQGETTE